MAIDWSKPWTVTFWVEDEEIVASNFEQEDTKAMKKETRKERRARQKDQELLEVLLSYGNLEDQIERLKAFQRDAEERATKLLGPERKVSAGGYDYDAVFVPGCESRWLRRIKQAENLGERKLTEGQWHHLLWQRGPGRS